MKAIRLPSGDHDARSPKCVNCLMVGGRFSSGLPGRVPWRSHGAAATAKVRSQERIGRIAADLASRVKNGTERVRICEIRRATISGHAPPAAHCPGVLLLVLRTGRFRANLG